MANRNFCVLLLYSKLSNTPALVHDLKSKGLTVIAVDNGKDFLTAIQDKEVDMVGLSVNHSQSTTLETILMTGSQSGFFCFAEEINPVSMQRINESKASIKIKNTASAYSMWQAIAPSVKEKESGGAKIGKVTIAVKTRIDDFGHVILIDLAEDGAPGAVEMLAGISDPSKGKIIITDDGTAETIGDVPSESVKRLKSSIQKILSPYKPKDLNQIYKFGPVNQFFAMTFTGEEERGLFVFAGGKNTEVAEEDITNFKRFVASELKNEAFLASEVYAIPLSLENVYEWARKNAAFSFTYKGKTENVVSFVRSGSVFPEFIPAEEGMLKFPLESLPQHPKLPFELYLYFNRNEKLLPYIKEGDAVTYEKIDKILQRGVKDIFVKKEELPKVYTLFLETALQSLYKIAKAA